MHRKPLIEMRVYEWATLGIPLFNKLRTALETTLDVTSGNLYLKINGRSVLIHGLQFGAANVVVILFDLTSKDSFDKISSVMQHYGKDAPETVRFILVGMNADLEKRVVSINEAGAFARDYGAEYIEMNTNPTELAVNELFERAVELVQIQEENLRPQSPDLQPSSSAPQPSAPELSVPQTPSAPRPSVPQIGPTTQTPGVDFSRFDFTRARLTNENFIKKPLSIHDLANDVNLFYALNKFNKFKLIDEASRRILRKAVLTQIIKEASKDLLKEAYNHPYFSTHRHDTKTRAKINVTAKSIFSTEKSIYPTKSQRLIQARIDELEKKKDLKK